MSEAPPGGSRWTEADYERAAEAMANMDGASGNSVQPGHRDAARAALDAVFPVGGPDDERLVEKVAEAIEGASPIHLDRASPGWAIDAARAAVAAVRAAGGGES